MKNLILVIFAVMICSMLYAQKPGSFLSTDFELQGLTKQALKGDKIITSYDEVLGSPYLNSELVPGNVRLANGDEHENIPLRYNIYADKFEYKNEEGLILELAEHRNHDVFELADNVFEYLKYKNGNYEFNGCLQVLAKGKISLYKKINIGFKPEQEAGPYRDEEKASFFDKPAEFYISINGEDPQLAKNPQKILSAQMPEIESYIKKEKLNLNKQDDLIKAVNYCNK